MIMRCTVWIEKPARVAVRMVGSGGSREREEAVEKIFLLEPDVALLDIACRS